MTNTQRKPYIKYYLVIFNADLIKSNQIGRIDPFQFFNLPCKFYANTLNCIVEPTTYIWIRVWF